MRRCHLVIFPVMATLCLAGSVLAESPLPEEPHLLNVQQLLSTHLCPGCDLADADLRGAHLIGADLRDANLTGADLSWVNLEGADLTGADLTGANLTGAFLTNATLINADLDNANFSQAQLYFVDVTGASLDNVNLAGATIVGTPISIGNGVDPELEEEPIISPPELWQLDPPSDVHPGSSERIDVPEPVMPSLHRHRGPRRRPRRGPCHPRYGPSVLQTHGPEPQSPTQYQGVLP
ncbi:MAG: pentapeptide repeat-containing protein [Leptolyngbya sp. SIOISBB]|nr:pentapeptide repeat-containing protein [Leptolyngbya sp. SIOISBB]